MFVQMLAIDRRRLRVLSPGAGEAHRRQPQAGSLDAVRDESQSYLVGIWASERGKWKVAYTEEEYCEILEGRSVISDLSGNAVTVSPGDRFVVPRGFAGTWEVVEPTRKVFVIHQPAA